MSRAHVTHRLDTLNNPLHRLIVLMAADEHGDGWAYVDVLVQPSVRLTFSAADYDSYAASAQALLEVQP